MDTPHVIPRPAHLQTTGGSFDLRRVTAIFAPQGGRPAARHLQALLRAHGRAAELNSTPGDATFVLERIDAPDLGPEGYRLTVTPNRVQLQAHTDAGLFYAVQTLRQLLPLSPEDDDAIPALEIMDRPRFGWRGLHLDVARHFFSVDHVTDLLDRMAVHKLNRFHWHLTEDQGWRFEVPAYPDLTRIGAWRPGDGGRPYGGFYSRDQVRRVVDHARNLHIEVVPEIEMPGHAQAALAAYPQLACTDGPFEVWSEWGISDEVYCAGNDDVFALLETVLEDVIEFFPGDFVHIGGDECPKRRWRDCPKCQTRMRTEGLRDEDELQSYFMKRIAAFLAARGKKPIGWDEILEGGLAPGAAVMSWRGTEGGILAARSGHDVVMTPHSHVYLDYKHYDEEGEPGRLGVTSLEKVYSFEPIPTELDPEQARHILGAQANVWTEGIRTGEELEGMVFPRLCALAEVVWSPPDKDWEDFRRRLWTHGGRLEALGIRYHRDRAIW